MFKLFQIWGQRKPTVSPFVINNNNNKKTGHLSIPAFCLCVCSVSLSRLPTISWCTHPGRPLNFSQQAGGYFVSNFWENPLTAAESTEWLMETLTFCPGLPISPWQQEDAEEEQQGQQSLNVLPKCICQSCATSQINQLKQVRKFNPAGWDNRLLFLL